MRDNYNYGEESGDMIKEMNEAMNNEISEAEMMSASLPKTVTEMDVEKYILHECYFTAQEGVDESGAIYRNPSARAHRNKSLPLELLTICVLVLENGFTVIGTSACADPLKFDETIGRSIAFQNAKNEVWKLLGFKLRDQMYRQENKTISKPDESIVDRHV